MSNIKFYRKVSEILGGEHLDSIINVPLIEDLLIDILRGKRQHWQNNQFHIVRFPKLPELDLNTYPKLGLVGGAAIQLLLSKIKKVKVKDAQFSHWDIGYAYVDVQFEGEYAYVHGKLIPSKVSSSKSCDGGFTGCGYGPTEREVTFSSLPEVGDTDYLLLEDGWLGSGWSSLLKGVFGEVVEECKSVSAGYINTAIDGTIKFVDNVDIIILEKNHSIMDYFLSTDSGIGDILWFNLGDFSYLVYSAALMRCLLNKQMVLREPGINAKTIARAEKWNSRLKYI